MHACSACKAQPHPPSCVQKNHHQLRMQFKIEKDSIQLIQIISICSDQKLLTMSTQELEQSTAADLELAQVEPAAAAAAAPKPPCLGLKATTNLSPAPGQPLICCRTGRKIRRNPGVLVRWIYLHERNYYPTKAEKEELCQDAGMTMRQLNDWFANARRNIKKKGMEYWKKKHSPYSARLTQPGRTLCMVLYGTVATGTV